MPFYAEEAPCSSATGITETPAQLPIPGELEHRRAQTLNIARWEHHPGLTSHDHFRHTSTVVRNDREPGGHRLHDHPR